MAITTIAGNTGSAGIARKQATIKYGWVGIMGNLTFTRSSKTTGNNEEGDDHHHDHRTTPGSPGTAREQAIMTYV